VVSTDRRRLARSLIRVYKHRGAIREPVIEARLAQILITGEAIDFAWRLREHGRLTPELARHYAERVGIAAVHLRSVLLPAMAACDMVDFRYDDSELTDIDEYVGVGATVAEQCYALLEELGPTPLEVAVLHSVDLGSFMPLFADQHRDELVRRGFTDKHASDALKMTLSVGVNQAIAVDGGDRVIYSPYVWGSRVVPIAQFLRSLPSTERDMIVGLSEQAASMPGIAIPRLAGVEPAVVTAAKKVGLIQAATVKSTNNPIAQETYLFSPVSDALSDAIDDELVTTEALHGRKLFTAHMVFAHDRARRGHGRVHSPVVLVEALLNRGSVGPATNIGTDYHSLEAAGIVRVNEVGSGRANLHLIKREIVEGSLSWLREIYGGSGGGHDLGLPSDLRSPTFVEPEQNRLLRDQRTEADEIMESSLLELRRAAQRAARSEDAY